MNSIREPLRDLIGRVLYEEPGKDLDAWHLLSEERREPWRQDADRVIPFVADRLRDILKCWLAYARGSAEIGADKLDQIVRETKECLAHPTPDEKAEPNEAGLRVFRALASIATIGNAETRADGESIELRGFCLKDAKAYVPASILDDALFALIATTTGDA